MMTGPEHEAFRKAIVEKPHDDLPRLVYADWLDEHGEPEAAARIRVERLTPDVLYRGRTADATAWHRYAAELLSGVVPKSWRVIPEAHPRDNDAASSRHWGEWVNNVNHYSGYRGGSVRNPFLVCLRHGFITSVGGDIRQLTKVLPALFRSQPVTEVGVLWMHVEREAFVVSREQYRRMTGDGNPVLLLNYNRIPRPVWDRLTPEVWPTTRLRNGIDFARSYPDRASACDDLSRAFVAHGRELAGLPPVGD